MMQKFILRSFHAAPHSFAKMFAGLKNFFCRPHVRHVRSTSNEVNEIIRAFEIIRALNNQKARRQLDRETKFIKYANPAISVYLSQLFNLCISTVVFPDSLKIAEVMPIFQKRKRRHTN